MITLNSQELVKLNQLIEENLRVGRGQRPVYVDIANNLDRILAKQNYVVFGRRGSGKSTLLLTAKAKAENEGFLCIYFDSELIKENPFPDVLISILTKVFEYLLEQSKSTDRGFLHRLGRLLPGRQNSLHKRVATVIEDLQKLRTEPEAYELARKTISTRETGGEAGVRLGLEHAGVGGRLDKTSISTVQEATETTIVKIKRLQQNLEIYHALLDELVNKLNQDMMLFLDDFYFISKRDQPDVVDYLHRLSKGTRMNLKLGTIRYRTLLYQMSRETGRTIGVELNNDIFPINLDYTLEDLAVMDSFLDQILQKFADRVGIHSSDLDNLFTGGGKKLLHLASGGVPRDFLNLFVKSQSIAKAYMLNKMQKQRVVGEAARQYLNETKRPNLFDDSVGEASPLEYMIDRICRFSIEDKRKTVFLVGQDEGSRHPEEYDRLKQLMDLRFVHIVDSHTSATYGGRRRYEGYMVDAGLWASPRRPGLIEVDFDKRDESGRKDELRNCRIFPLV